MRTTYQSDVGRIASMFIKHARSAFTSQERINNQWRDLNYTEAPDYERAIEESEAFAEQLANFGIEIKLLPDDDGVGLDSIYARDSSIACNKGMILCKMGKKQRRGEPQVEGSSFRESGIPILGEISGDGCIEGGDVVWLDERTIAVGRGYRTNVEGIRQLKNLLGDCIDNLIEVHLPHFRGPGDVFHLMSIVSPIDKDLALVYSPLVPVSFRETLLARGYRLVEVPEEEFDSMGGNVLAVAPRVCIMLEGNPETCRRLVAQGAEVHRYRGDEISAKGCGGPTCLTRPILREENR